MVDGDEPQHPPMMSAPAAIRSLAAAANCSSVQLYTTSPLRISGRPLLGCARMGQLANGFMRRTTSITPAGFVEQFTPSASTPSDERVSATISGVEPVSVRDCSSNVMVAKIGLLQTSRMARIAARSSYRSLNVSKRKPSTRSAVYSAT